MSCWWLEISHGEVFIPCYYSATQSCPTLCNPMDCGTPGLLAHHFPKFAQVHVHSIGDAIQLSHPLMPSSLSDLSLFPASETFPISQLYPSGDQSTRASASASVLLKCIQSWFPLIGLISLLSKGLSRVFSRATVRRYQFFDVLPSLWSSSHNHTWPLGRPEPWLYGPSSEEWCLCF